MIDSRGLLKYLLKHIWLIAIVVLAAMIATYLLTAKLPDTYYSEAKISTGISELAKIDNTQTNYLQARQTYANITGMMKMKRVLGLVSNSLLIHDLLDEKNAFRPYSDKMRDLDGGLRRKVATALQERLASGQPSQEEVDGVNPKTLAQSMGYDEAALLEGLSVNRDGDSDFISVGFISESPELSAFVANTLATEFIQYYQRFTAANDTRSVLVLDSLLKEKARIMQAKQDTLEAYRVQSGILDANTQSSTLYQQIAMLQSQRADRLTEVQSLQRAINDIKRQLANPQSDYLRPGNSAANNELVELDRQLQLANKQYIDNNFNAADKRVVDSLRQRRNELAGVSVTSPSSNSRANRQNLESELIRLETSLSLARGGVSSIERELNNARARHNAMVPMDAGLQTYQREADIATQEYMEVLNRVNQAGLASNIGLRLSVVELGLPGIHTMSKRPLYIGLSGFATLMLCLAVLTLIFLFDRRIKSKEQLAMLTNGKVVGVMNLIGKSYSSVRSIWDNGNATDAATYKDQLRSLRFDISRELAKDGSKVLGIISLSDGAGKSFLSASLAYAFAITGRKVLLIGEEAINFNDISKGEAIEGQAFEQFLVKRQIQIEDLITTLSTNKNIGSLLELQNMESLMTSFEMLRKEFDIIIIDAESCRNLNQMKEWLLFSDVSLGVIETGKAVSDNEKDLIAYLNNQKGFLGWVLNKFRLSA